MGPKSTLRYHCERLPYVTLCVCRVGQVYTPVGLIIDSDIRDTLEHE
jgi:hypothetical protein